MKKILLITVLFLTTIRLIAEEGMWIPLYLKTYNEYKMKQMGMKISASDIYNENMASMKDAIVLFNGGCTGALISHEGLLLTNHHCGYSAIQQHSSLEHDYLKDGFWAMSHEEELPNPELQVIFLVRMEDVTNQILQDVNSDMDAQARDSIIKKNIHQVCEKAIEGTHYDASVVPFYCENQYFLFVNEIFKDVRLVGAPPSNIGKFGGDTDNWMWPRHTGDFSLFRIYADKENKPAEYSKENVPYRPKKIFEISLNGIEEDDFTFVFGYPAHTYEYLPSYAIEETVDVVNPVRIEIRTQRLNIMSEAMNIDPKVRIQYASKYASVSNGWKKWQGENLGINRMNGIAQKKIHETKFQQWTQLSNESIKQYGSILKEFENNFSTLKDYKKAQVFFSEAINSIELLGFSNKFQSLIKLDYEKTPDTKKIAAKAIELKEMATDFYKDYFAPIDQQFAVFGLNTYLANVSPEFIPLNILEANNKGIEKVVSHLFTKSIFLRQNEIFSMLNELSDTLKNGRAIKEIIKKIEKDPAFQFITQARSFINRSVMPSIQFLTEKNNHLQRLYMKAQQEMEADRIFYPDANFTLRVTYGNVKGYEPADGVRYNYFTTLEGIIEKENPDIYDYIVEPKLKQLYQNKEYGRYADADGRIHVAFTATNHTTGGNSGSPVLNADGYLIGINFDRCWEGTMSDLMYNSDICRNISLDIRYCLFIIDKFANAEHLIKEMSIVQ